MKTLITIFLAGMLFSSDFNHEDMLEYSGVIKYSETEVVNLEIGKSNYSSSSSLTEENKVVAKGVESTVKVDNSRIFEFVIRSSYKDEKQGFKMTILKFEIEKEKRVAKSVLSQLKPVKNKDMGIIPYKAVALNKEKGIFSVKLNSKLVAGNYGIVFGENNGKTIPLGYMNTKTTLFFDVK